MLVIAVPVLVICAFAIRLSSTGPALFRQQRVGRDQKLFTLYKLRTMRVGTGDRPSHDAGQENITSVGSVLRRTKLDELPQLINVIKGEMSLVGPRPCLPTQSELIAARESEGVFQVLPGVTGPAQLQGVDMSTPIKLAQIDGQYARSASIREDIKLILATIFKGRGDAALARKQK